MTFNPIDGYHGDNEDEESLGIPDLHSTTNNHTLPKDKKQVPYQSDQSSKSESDLRSEHEWKPTMDWSSFEEQIKLISEKSHLRTARHHPDLRHLKKKKFYLVCIAVNLPSKVVYLYYCLVVFVRDEDEHC